MQHIIERAKHEGFPDIVLSINYLGDQINFLLVVNNLAKITICARKNPGESWFIGINESDIRPTYISHKWRCNFRTALRCYLDFHTKNATATMAIKSHEWQNPFGVVDLDGLEICGLRKANQKLY